MGIVVSVEIAKAHQGKTIGLPLQYCGLTPRMRCLKDRKKIK